MQPITAPSARAVPAPFGRFPAPATQPQANAPMNPVCATCAVRAVCFAGRAQQPESSRVMLPIARRRLEPGDELRRAGPSADSVYILRAGTMKSTMPTADGGEQVTGFHLPGDLVGYTAVARAASPTTTTALEQVEVCAIPYAELLRPAGEGRSLRQQFWSAISGEIVRSQQAARVLATRHADARVAAFLMELSERMRERGYSPHEFHMRMTRREIGSYVGVRLETVSRALASFTRQRLIQVTARHVRIVDLAGLQAEADR